MARDTDELRDRPSLHRISMDDELEYGAFDDDGNGVICDRCGADMRWNRGPYICTECGQEMDRETYFNHIGAEIPSEECLTCKANYPRCKSWCDNPNIRFDDPHAN